MISLAVDVRSKMFANGVLAIRNLSLRAQPGEFLAIVGPSGAGKTTLLNLVAGLDAAFEGAIRVATAPGNAGARMPRTGYMFQEPRLMPWLTVEQNIRLVARTSAGRHDAAVIEERMRQLLELVELAAFGNMYPGQLSVGMRRRVALLRAFIVEPDLLLMDEPFESLDAPTAAQLRGLLLDLWQRTSPTVLFVTHGLQEAIVLADRILFLSARPATVILDYPVPLPRPREIDGEQVRLLQQQLLAHHPQLLEGLRAAPERLDAIRDRRAGQGRGS